MADKFGSSSSGLDSPASDGFAVTKSDSTVFTQPTRGLYVGGGGDVAVRMVSGAAVTFVGVPTGSVLPIRVDKVLSTGTDATDIVGLT